MLPTIFVAEIVFAGIIGVITIAIFLAILSFISGRGFIPNIPNIPDQSGGMVPITCPTRTTYNAKLYQSDSINISEADRHRLGLFGDPKPSGVAIDMAPAKDGGSAGAVIPVAGADGSSYYLDPKLMSPAQLQKFKFYAKLDMMTVTDYTNWLLLHEPQQLAPYHRSNLRIITRGGRLEQSDLPRVTRTPPTAMAAYATAIGGETIAVPQPEMLGYQGYNSVTDESNPNEGPATAEAPQRSLRHLEYVNPDEPLKAWALTHIDHDTSASTSANKV